MAGLKKTDKTSNSERLAGFLKETPGGALSFREAVPINMVCSG